MDNTEKKVLLLQSKINEIKKGKEQKGIITEMKKIGIEELPYSYSALKKFIDSETMSIHYNKHYKGYVDKLNAALSKRKGGDKDLEQIIKNISSYSKQVRNNAGGAFNHALFWNMLTPTPKKLTGPLLKRINKDYGNFINFKKEFETVAKERFGSGWVWLVIGKNNRLKIVSTANQDNPLMNVVKDGGFPILGLDLWEHAYYLKYRNKRDEYIINFWKVVNWDFVSKMFSMKTETDLIEENFKRIIMKENDGKQKNYIEACTRTEESFFKDLMSKEKIGRKYKIEIKDILKEIPWLEYRPPQNGINDGFYFEGERHRLSWLGGNFRAFCLIAKSVSNALVVGNEPPLDFKGSEENQYKSIVKLVNTLRKYKDRIFATDSPLYMAIIENMEQSKEKGDTVESITFGRLNNEFGGENVEIVSGPGSASDMSGNDGFITLNGERKSIQIKPLWKIEEIDNMFHVYTTGKLEMYTQDWMVFSNKSRTVIFSSNGMSLGQGYYIFDQEPLYTLP